MPVLNSVTIIYITMAVCLAVIAIIYPISVGSSMQEVSWCNDSCVTRTYITSLVLGIIVLFLIVLRCIFNRS